MAGTDPNMVIKMDLTKLLDELRELEASLKPEFYCCGITVSSEYWFKLMNLPENVDAGELQKIFPGGRILTGIKGIQLIEKPSQMKSWSAYYSPSKWEKAKRIAYAEKNKRGNQ